MKYHKKVDYIIIGQGLAGSCLALQLIFRDKSVVVFDQPQLNHCTSVAAGLFNPITGKMLAKTWLADTIFPYLHSFYRHAENHLEKKFIYPLPLYRPFGSVEEQNEWMGRSTHALMKEYIANIFLHSTHGTDVHDPVGGVLIRHGGYVDTGVFTEAVRSLLKDSNSYREEKLNEAELEIHDMGISYRDLTAKKIIYCGGVNDLNSRFFSWLPIRPLKGETLLIHMAEIQRIYNRGVYIVPGNLRGEFKVGATYDFDLTPAVTTAGKAELEAKLKELVRMPYTIFHQNWGIRPTTHDRRILLGPHPSHPNLVIFNGLGTKGISLAPYFSGQLAGWLTGEGEIDSEVNIQRFKSLYFEV